MKKIIAVLVTSLLFQMSYTQLYSQDILSKITLPTPESSRFMKYLGYPISPATGLIDVSIPIYTIDEPGLKIPLALSYHSSGIRIQDLSGTIGYGWTLLPGLRISRTIMGKPDEYSPPVPQKYKDILDGKTTLTGDNLKEYKINTAVDFGSYHVTPEAGTDDLQNDIFTIHLPNSIVSFIMEYTDNKYNIKTITSSPLVITPQMDMSQSAKMRLYGFNVLDEYGNTYYFGQVNSKGLNNGNSNSDFEYTEGLTYPTGWMLRQVKLANDEKIDFTYYTNGEIVVVDNHDDPHRKKVEESYTFIDNGSTNVRIESEPSQDANAIANAFRALTGSDGWTDGGINYNDRGRHYSKVLSSIKTSNVLVKLDYNISPNWMSNYARSSEYQLKSISVNSFDKLIEKVELSHIQTSFLDKIIFTLQKDIYLFEYDMQDGQFEPHAIDWWGYFNGKLNNQSSIPKQTVEIIKNEIHYNSPFPSIEYININIPRKADYPGFKYLIADRNPSEEHRKAKSLKKITYPTGGSLSIFYGPNKSESGQIYSGLRVDSTILYDPISKKSIKEKYTYRGIRGESFDETIDDEGNINVVKHMVFGYEMVWGTPVLTTRVQSTSNARVRRISTFSPLETYSNVLSNIWYSEVEKDNGESKTVYKHNLHKSDQLSSIKYDTFFRDYHPLNIYSHLYKTPRLTDKYEYKNVNGQSQIVKEVHHKYTTKYVQSKIQYLLVPFALYGDKKSDWLLTVYDASDKPTKIYKLFTLDPIIDKEFFLFYGDILLEETEEIDYENSNKAVKTTKYTYDPDRKYNIKEKSIVNSDGKKYTEKYYYTNNTIPNKASLSSSQQYTLEVLDNANYKSVPIQEIMEVDNKRISSTLLGYKKINSSFYVPESIYKQVETGAFIKEKHIDRHDSKGNILQYTGLDNMPVSYLWSYNNRYPIVELKNSIYSQAENLASRHFGMTAIQLGVQSSPNEDKIKSLSNLGDESTYITTYTYKPFVGITSSTDWAGKTTFYEYDNAYRLKAVYIENSANQKETIETFQYGTRGPYADLTARIPNIGAYIGKNTINIEVTGGSGSFSYDWLVKDVLGNVIAREVNSDKNKIEIEVLKFTAIEVSCTVKDKETGHTVFATSKIGIEKRKIGFTNIQYLQQTNQEIEISAELDLPIAVVCNVTLSAHIPQPPAGSNAYTQITLNAGGQYYYYTSTVSPFSINVPLPRGKTYFSVSLYTSGDGAHGQGRIILNYIKDNDYCELGGGTTSLDL